MLPPVTCSSVHQATASCLGLSSYSQVFSMGVANCRGAGMPNTHISLSALPPPALPPFCPLFASLVNILQSDVMLCIMGTILQWAVEHNGYAWSESMLQRVRFLTENYACAKEGICSSGF